MCRFALFFLLAGLPLSARADDDATAGWKVGLATVKITPAESMWMAGYASRDKPSEGVAQDLFAKAMALEDAEGTRLVIITLDLIGIPRAMRDHVEQEVGKRYKLPPESLWLNASHTHCGPELRSRMKDVYAMDDEQLARSARYYDDLQEKLIALVGHALDAREPASLSYAQARCGFAMNRRRPTETEPTNAPNREGPVDHNVPVLIVENAEKELKGLLFGYNCHATTLSIFMFCGDYPGYAQQYLQEDHPGCTAMFLNGCSGDQNPYPRREFKYVQYHGRSLATAVEAALETRRDPVSGPLRVAYGYATLQFDEPPSREELELRVQSPNKYEQRHAQRMLRQLDEQGSIATTYDAPMQAAALGDGLLIVGIAGEVVVDYSLRLKAELKGPAVWVAGYSNDVFGYLPSRRVLEEGGYEGGGAMRYTNFPGPFAVDVEDRVIEKVRELVKEVRAEDQEGR